MLWLASAALKHARSKGRRIGGLSVVSHRRGNEHFPRAFDWALSRYKSHGAPARENDLKGVLQSENDNDGRSRCLDSCRDGDDGMLSAQFEYDRASALTCACERIKATD